MWAYGRGQTHRQTDTQTRVTIIHFSWSTTHAKCNNFVTSSDLGHFWSRREQRQSTSRSLGTVVVVVNNEPEMTSHRGRRSRARSAGRGCIDGISLWNCIVSCWLTSILGNRTQVDYYAVKCDVASRGVRSGTISVRCRSSGQSTQASHCHCKRLVQ